MTSDVATAVREFAGPVGRLEALLDEPDPPLRAAVVVGHPHPQHGGTMHNKVVYRTAKALRAIGCAVLRFNFRGVGASDGSFDRGIGERDDFRAGLDFLERRYPETPLWTAGFSFGAWVALTVGGTDPRVRVLVGVAPPAHYDHEAWRRSHKPKFLIHGERDDLVPIQELRRLYGQLEEPKELVVIDGADHLFDGKVSEVGDAIVDLLGDYTP